MKEEAPVSILKHDGNGKVLMAVGILMMLRVMES